MTTPKQGTKIMNPMKGTLIAIVLLAVTTLAAQAAEKILGHANNLLTTEMYRPPSSRYHRPPRLAVSLSPCMGAWSVPLRAAGIPVRGWGDHSGLRIGYGCWRNALWSRSRSLCGDVNHLHVVLRCDPAAAPALVARERSPRQAMPHEPGRLPLPDLRRPHAPTLEA